MRMRLPEETEEMKIIRLRKEDRELAEKGISQVIPIVEELIKEETLVEPSVEEEPNIVIKSKNRGRPIKKEK